MAVILKSGGGVKFPVEVTCSKCKRLSDVTEVADFRKMRGGATGRDLEDYPMVYVFCPICGKKAFPEGILHPSLYKMVEEYELVSDRTPGIREVKGIRLPKSFKVCCFNGNCHGVYEVSTLDGIHFDQLSEKYYINCPNEGCGGSKIYIYDREVTSMLAGVFIGIR